MSYLFNECFSLKSVDINKWPSYIENISHMFANSYSLINVDGISFMNSENVLDASHMFENCKEIEILSLKFNTINIKNMEYMFSGFNH